jgi:hypothetical protein
VTMVGRRELVLSQETEGGDQLKGPHGLGWVVDVHCVAQLAGQLMKVWHHVLPM